MIHHTAVGSPKMLIKFLCVSFPLILWLVGVLIANHSPCNTCLTTFALLHWLGLSHTAVSFYLAFSFLLTPFSLLDTFSPYMTLSNQVPLILSQVSNYLVLSIILYYLVQCHTFLHFFILADLLADSGRKLNFDR